MRAALLALLLAGPCLAQGLVSPSTTGILPCSYYDDQLCRLNGWYILKGGLGGYSPASGASLYAINGVKNNIIGVTVSRASSKTCQNATGKLVTLASNTPCVESGTQCANCVGLYIESSATNLLLQSNNFGNAAWTVDQGSVTQNATGPDGTSNSAWTWTNNGTNAQHRLYQGGQFGSGTYTWGIYAKAGTACCIMLNFDGTSNHALAVDLTNGAVVLNGAGQTATVLPAGNGYYRVSSTVAATGTGFAIFLMCETEGQCASPASAGYAGTPASLYVYGAQDEAQAWVSSYIPTGASTATRAADLVSFANPLTSAQQSYAIGGTLQATRKPASSSCYTFMEAGNANAANAYELQWSANINSNQLNTWDNASAVGTFSLGPGGYPTQYSSVSAPPPAFRNVAQNYGTGLGNLGAKFYLNGAGECYDSNSCGTKNTSTAGTGTGLTSSQPTTIYVGARSDGNNCNVNGFMTDMGIAVDTSGFMP